MCRCSRERCIGVSVCRCVGVRVSGVSVCRCVGVSVCRVDGCFGLVMDCFVCGCVVGRREIF